MVAVFAFYDVVVVCEFEAVASVRCFSDLPHNRFPFPAVCLYVAVFLVCDGVSEFVFHCVFYFFWVFLD